MYLARIICVGACLIGVGSASAQVTNSTPPAAVPSGAPTIPPAAADADATNPAATAEPAATPEDLETAPSLEQESDLPPSADVESGTAEEPAATAPATAPVERTEAMPNAITREAQPAPTANAPKHKADNSWRYRWSGGHWWYRLPNRTWMIWEGSQWTKYADYLARFESRSRISNSRGYRRPADSNGPYYNGPYSSGYRGSASPRYYDDYRNFQSGNVYDNGSRYGGSAPAYGDWRGSSNGGGYGGYFSPYNSGTFQGGLGAGAGGGIGAAAAGS